MNYVFWGQELISLHSVTIPISALAETTHRAGLLNYVHENNTAKISEELKLVTF